VTISAEDVNKMIDDKIKEACQPGGTIHAATHTGDKNDKRKDGIAGILSMKGDRMIPDKFENEVKSGTLFRHWSEEVKSYLKIIDGASMMLVNIAEKNPEKKTDKDTVKEYLTGQMQTMEKDKFFIEYFNKFDQDIENVYVDVMQVKDEQLHTLLMYMLTGEAKEMVRNVSPSGIEGWRILNHRWNRKTQFGATQIAEMIRTITPAKNVEDVYGKINQLERLHLELQKNLGEDIVNGQSVKVVYGEAFKKADLLKVVNEDFNIQLKKEGKELETMSYQELVDKVQSYVRINAKGKSSRYWNVRQRRQHQHELRR